MKRKVPATFCQSTPDCYVVRIDDFKKGRLVINFFTGNYFIGTRYTYRVWFGDFLLGKITFHLNPLGMFVIPLEKGKEKDKEEIKK